ncbi:MAG: penicillin-binding protein 2 [Candidatus Kapaibacteriota bacterium]
MKLNLKFINKSTKNSTNEEIEFGSSNRSRFIEILLLIIFLLFFLRLFQLQILSGEKYKVFSEAQAIKKMRIIPPRGQIFDLNGKLLVHNQASFNLTITPASFDSTSYKILKSLIEIDTNIVLKAFDLKKKFERYSPFVVMHDLDFQTVSMIQEYKQFLRGVSVEVEGKRLYQDSVRMPHILGYIRQVSDEQLKKYPYLQSGDQIGQVGLEKIYDDILKGTEGYEIVAFNRKGERVSKLFDEELQDQSPVGGATLYLGIDFNLQYYAEKLLDGKRGAIVGIDPRNGEIRFLVSKPDYSPDVFNGKLSEKDANYLFKDPSHPLMNRAIQGVYPPGSTWKMLMAIAGLQEGVITPSSTFYCGGAFHFGNRDIKCHGKHGNINVLNAIQVSCNPFFSQLALKEGIDIFSKWGNLFGFGKPTGIDLSNESRGVFPDKNWLDKVYGNNVSYPGRLVNFGIGQGEINVTPMQMAQYVATIANRGVMNQPHIVREIENMFNHQKEKVSYESKKLPIDDWIFDIIHKGMFNVVNVRGGTATNASIPGVKVCGKTGTAQNPHGGDHSWFICFAPMEKPEIAIVVIVENAGFGASVAAPIARNLLMKYFHIDYTIKKDSTKVVESLPQTAD